MGEQQQKQDGGGGIYAIDLLVDYRLSMTLMLQPNGSTPVLDYWPENMEWTQRDPRMWTECGRKWTFLNESNKDEDGEGKEGEHPLETLVQLDGRHRLVNTFDGLSPGPTIVVPLGAEVLLRIKNRLHSQALTVHVHGLDKRGRWWTDGVPYVQQCPISPGTDYSYRFIADTPGTHWYHGHLMADRGSGLIGGFIVLRPDERKEFEVEEGENDGKTAHLQVAREYLAIVQDLPPADPSQIYLDRLHWRKKWIGHTLEGEEEEGCERVERTFDGTLSRELPVSAILIGGKGWHNQSDIRRRPSRLPLANFAIRPGENILLRLVNAGISQGVFVWLEGHTFWVISADGTYIRPIKVDSLLIFSGERYDILVRGLAKPARANYRLIFELMEYYAEDTPRKWMRRRPTVGLANLRYNNQSWPQKGHDDEDDEVDWDHSGCRMDKKCVVLNCPFGQFPEWANLTCIHADALESIGQKEEDLDLLRNDGFEGNGTFKELFANLHDGLNGWRYQSPKGIPYFGKDAAKQCDPTKCDRWAEEAAWSEHCQCFLNFHFRLGQIVQIVPVSSGGMAHPFHLHGTKFVVLRMGFAEQHPGNGTVKGLNRHLACTKPGMRCVELEWANKSWTSVRMPELNKNPVLRDTVVVPANGFVVIRFRANNPGWFFAHCHLLMHSMDGMNFAFKVGTDGEIPPPPAGFPHSCGNYEEPPTMGTTHLEKTKSMPSSSAESLTVEQYIFHKLIMYTLIVVVIFAYYS